MRTMSSKNCIAPTKSVVEFYSDVGVPVAVIKQKPDSNVNIHMNTPFKNEFNLDSCNDTLPLENAISNDNTPINRFPEVCSPNQINLDLIDHNDVMYLRKRVWSDECIIEIYDQAGSKLPHHQHISLLHRVFRHNLRNETNAICGWASVISEQVEDDSESVSHAADTVLERAEALSQISKEAGELHDILHSNTELTDINVSKVIEKAVCECRERFDQTNIEINIEPDLQVLANEKIRYVIDNLVDNAIRHNEESTVVEVSATSDTEGVIVTISDDGKGLPPVEKDIITGDCDITQLSHGSGLGLWVSRRVLDMCCANIDVETVNKQGTEFSITFHDPDDSFGSLCTPNE